MFAIPGWTQAFGWGLLSGSALLLGAAIGFYLSLPRRIVAYIMAFGAGVLLSALSFELIEDAQALGGIVPTVLGVLGGAGVYTLANYALEHRGAKHRKRSGEHQPSEEEHEGSGMALAVGALLDGILESIVIGVGMLSGGAVSLVTVAAIFMSNLPEGLSSSAGMKQAGRSQVYVFSLWGGITLISGISALVGYLVFGNFSPQIIALTTAVAAGAILAMLVDTMIPEAYAEAHTAAGAITVVGFLVAFVLSQMEG